MAEYDVDLFVIGGGSGGVRAARIAAAFFMVRISLAAASAAGEAGLSAVGGAASFCWADAGAPISARLNARAAADKLPERLFIPILLNCGAKAVQQYEFRWPLRALPCGPSR